MTRSYIAFTVQKRELTLENPFLYWKGFCLIRFCTVKLLCCVIIELMVGAASDETDYCGTSPHLRL